MSELPGHIGPYEVRDRLGHGGMGVVYLGFDPMLDRPVAIKVLKVPDDETRRRFLRQARLAARVHHPHIVSIYAVGEHEGNPYFAMEFIAGRTMAQVIRSGDPVPLARKVHWLSELCAGLAHAHESGIVHRDIKPSNVMIADGTGSLRLMDLGIAHGNEASGMTMAGVIIGTPQYMSPEQITGQPVDARSDVFSVGAVAYELLTGRQAFGGDNLYHVSRQIVGEQPRPIESFVPDVPEALVKAIAKCLQKDAAARTDSAKVLEREFLSIARRLDPDHMLFAVQAGPAKPVNVTTSRRELLREAEEASQTGTVEEAEAAINALADVAPRHPELERLRRAHQEQIDERQVAALTSRARQALQQDRLDEVESLIAEALALAPDSPDALAVQQKLSDRTRAQRIARLVAQASRAIYNDDVPGARKAIDALVKVDASHRDVARLEARLAAMDTETDEHAARAPEAAPRPAAPPDANRAARPAAPPVPPARPARPAAPPADASPVAPPTAPPAARPVACALPLDLAEYELIQRRAAAREHLAEEARRRDEEARRAAEAQADSQAGAQSPTRASREVPGGRIDRVHLSVVAPPDVLPREAFVVAVWAHLESQRPLVLQRALEATGQPVAIHTKGPTRVAHGTILTVRVRLTGAVIEPAEDTILWEGEIGAALFSARVPDGALERSCNGIATVFAHGVQIARIAFTIRVSSSQPVASSLLGRTVPHRTAFASYAREDLNEVGARIQGMQKVIPDLDVFWDVLSLRAGQRWEQELSTLVPSRDVFFLFWSEAASRSKWVEREWRCALEARGLDYIDPIPLVSPDEVPPPSELAALHFGDRLLPFTAARSTPIVDTTYRILKSSVTRIFRLWSGPSNPE